VTQQTEVLTESTVVGGLFQTQILQETLWKWKLSLFFCMFALLLYKYYTCVNLLGSCNTYDDGVWKYECKTV